MNIDFGGQTLTCTTDGGFFKKGSSYYCFADEGHDFWIHAPWLESTYGVNQIKVDGSSRENFIIKPNNLVRCR